MHYKFNRRGTRMRARDFRDARNSKRFTLSRLFVVEGSQIHRSATRLHQGETGEGGSLLAFYIYVDALERSALIRVVSPFFFDTIQRALLTCMIF